MKGMSLEEVMFALAKMTKDKEWHPSVDYPKLSNVFKTIITPSKKAKKALKEIGIDKLK